MKLYSASRAPNPRRVLIYLAEKGLNVPVSEVDLGALEQRSGEFTALNPFQRTPVLALDDGAVICESIAICRYFEELHPEPPLFGVGALARDGRDVATPARTRPAPSRRQRFSPRPSLYGQNGDAADR
jgi:glutathione S-transferase